MSLDKLFPCREKHAVKEASLTVFLKQPLNDFESFKGILSDDFKFELVKEQGVNFQILDGKPKVDTTPLKDVGFKFTQFDGNGKPIRIIQGKNELNRTYIIFHELRYIRWENFKSQFVTSFSAISKVKELLVFGFGLQFVDEFSWNSKDSIPYDDIFKPDNGIVPKILLGSRSVNYQIERNLNIENTEFVSEWANFQERIQVKGNSTGSESGSTLLLNHYISDQFDSVNNVSQLVDSAEFIGKVEQVHDINKTLLRNLLVDEILTSIGIKLE